MTTKQCLTLKAHELQPAMRFRVRDMAFSYCTTAALSQHRRTQLVHCMPREGVFHARPIIRAESPDRPDTLPELAPADRGNRCISQPAYVSETGNANDVDRQGIGIMEPASEAFDFIHFAHVPRDPQHRHKIGLPHHALREVAVAHPVPPF